MTVSALTRLLSASSLLLSVVAIPCLAQQPADNPYALVLGVAQDAGYPQANCFKQCCWPEESEPEERYPTSLAIVDPKTQQVWLLDCTWQLPAQLRIVHHAIGEAGEPAQTRGRAQPRGPVSIEGILLTHAHIGHYTGLMHLGREAMGSKQVSVFAMPRMKRFLESNGPWDQLSKLENIKIKSISDGQPIRLNERISVTPISVPHRDEYSETVGFIVNGANKSLLYLPDIDKWDRWERKIEDVLSDVDYAFLDATFYADGEIPGRDMNEIPHPFVEESILRFQGLDAAERAKVLFIHMNHTNPALRGGAAAEAIRRAGMAIAEQGSRVGL